MRRLNRALDQLGWGRDSFKPGRGSFSEKEGSLASERSVVKQIKVEVFCFQLVILLFADKTMSLK